MKHLSREKIALVIFFVLALSGLGALLFYISSIGHSMNVAASTIDEATGNMKDYTVVVYKGTVEPEKTKEEAVKNNSSQSSISSELNKRASESSSENTEELTAEEALTAEQAENNTKEELSVASLRNSYVKKEADVFELVVDDPTIYNSKTIVHTSRYTFGIVYVDKQKAKEPQALQKRIKEYRDSRVDFVIAVTTNLDYVKDIKDLNIVVSTRDEGLFPLGVSVDGVFYTDAANTKEVGSILISPSRVVSAKDVDRL